MNLFWYTTERQILARNGLSVAVFDIHLIDETMERVLLLGASLYVYTYLCVTRGCVGDGTDSAVTGIASCERGTSSDCGGAVCDCDGADVVDVPASDD